MLEVLTTSPDWGAWIYTELEMQMPTWWSFGKIKSPALRLILETFIPEFIKSPVEWGKSILAPFLKQYTTKPEQSNPVLGSAPPQFYFIPNWAFATFKTAAILMF